MLNSHIVRISVFASIVAGWQVISWADSNDNKNQDRFFFDKDLPVRLGPPDASVGVSPSELHRFDPNDIRRETLQLRKPELFASDRVKEQFVGHWKLVSYEIRRGDGPTTEWPMVGRLYYDTSGNMAAQLMPLSATPESPDRRYFAYFGTFDVDTIKGTVTHHVEGSVTTSWVGTDLVRTYAFEGDKLMLSLPNGGNASTNILTWIRIGAKYGPLSDPQKPFVYDVNYQE